MIADKSAPNTCTSENPRNSRAGAGYETTSFNLAVTLLLDCFLALQTSGFSLFPFACIRVRTYEDELPESGVAGPVLTL